MKRLLQYPNVIGYGLGVAGVNVFVTKKLPAVVLHTADIIPAMVDGYPTDVIETGIIRALQSRTDTWRPAPPGVSIGHHAITAGTFGCVVGRDGQRLILSNNHVMANGNDAVVGDGILQPGKHDGGTETIAHLERFVPINFGGASACPLAEGVAAVSNVFARMLNSSHRLKAHQENGDNLVDAATATPIYDDIVIDEILEIGAPLGTKGVAIGEAVKKSGRTTALTFGTITTIDATIRVQYGSKTATFVDQIISTHMSEPGDSGSLLVNEENYAVGLLFAGSDKVTIYNRIENVLSLLGVSINE